MYGVDPLFPHQIKVVGSAEQSNQTVGVCSPYSEGESERLDVDLDVVVADQDCKRVNGGSGDEPGIEAARRLADQRDGCSAEGGEREIVGQFIQGFGWCGGVSPEDEHGGDKWGRGVRGGNRLEERDSGLREAIDEDCDLI